MGPGCYPVDSGAVLAAIVVIGRGGDPSGVQARMIARFACVSSPMHTRANRIFEVVLGRSRKAVEVTVPFALRGARLARTAGEWLLFDFPWSGLVGVVLYLVTVAVTVVVTTPARFVLVIVPLLVLDLFVDYPFGVSTMTGLVLALPLLYSLMGAVFGSRGRGWRKRLGAEPLTQEEREVFENAVGVLPGLSMEDFRRIGLWIINSPSTDSAVRGRAFAFSRGTLENPAFPAVVGHEDGHLGLDGLLTEGLARLELWGDPFWMEPDEFAGEPLNDEEGRYLYAFLRYLVWVAGGRIALRLMEPLLAWYWRHREYMADRNAADLGQALDLAEFLEEYVLPFEAPNRRWLVNFSPHPPVSKRIERLRRLAVEGGSK